MKDSMNEFCTNFVFSVAIFKNQTIKVIECVKIAIYFFCPNFVV